MKTYHAYLDSFPALLRATAFERPLEVERDRPSILVLNAEEGHPPECLCDITHIRPVSKGEFQSKTLYTNLLLD